ncbi:MAG: LptF/LptG family permease [Fimbriimonadaceae bacterium]|nr:LptF/LptG family permease [Fimbriimonadaceae bacterium]QYK56236.1 MAG: LptF/LptG family permease [Fimbriimonadaceae bacterium]
MSRLDRLVLSELIGPWAFGVGIFTVLIMAGSFLFELTRYLSEGVSPAIVLQLTVLLLPGVLAKTFPMAVLLASLLAFGRLSGDSEIVALKAAGISVARIVAPVAVFGLFVSVLAFGFGEVLVPSATQRAVDLRGQIDADSKGRTAQPRSRPIYEEGRLRAFLTARDFDFVRRILTGVTITIYGANEEPTYYVYANELEYTNEKKWEIRGGASLTPADGGSKVEFQRAFPSEVPALTVTPEDLLAQALRDLDALSMRQMGQQIQRERENPAADPAQIANLEFGYWNKLTLPLGALVFGLVGAPLGIRSHRTPAATGFWLAVLIIFCYLLLSNVMSIAAQGGRFPSAFASFTPTVVGLVVAFVLIRKRDS